MLFSFVKELDDSAKLIKAIDDKQRAWRRNPRVVVWVVWIGGNIGEAKDWAEKNEIKNVAIAIASEDDSNLSQWNFHPMTNHTHVLVCGRKTTITSFTDLEPTSIDALESRLHELVKTRD